jgi:hypothetical protein
VAAMSAPEKNRTQQQTCRDLSAWDIDIEPSGAGLPAGSGTSDQGTMIFADK